MQNVHNMHKKLFAICEHMCRHKLIMYSRFCTRENVAWPVLQNDGEALHSTILPSAEKTFFAVSNVCRVREARPIYGKSQVQQLRSHSILVWSPRTKKQVQPALLAIKFHRTRDNNVENVLTIKCIPGTYTIRQ